ncbi:S-layer homology domain-containing protein [Arthrobacter sp. LjRoot14]|uniref:S-layer homology domain-containing protein n=1 Tax=Arthrobacter sp. LjRoot14 TaxID=3342265 RepID=UPI003ECF6F2D
MFASDRKRVFVALRAATLVVVLMVSGSVSAKAVGLMPRATVDLAAPRAPFADAQYPQDRQGSLTFQDVPAGIQFAREIGWLAASGVSTGWPDGTFRPVSAVNRDAMAAFMYRLAGKPNFTPPATSPFADVAPSNQFFKEITWLAGKGISTGWAEPNGTKTYRPLQAVNRDAMAAFMFRLAGSPPQTSGTAKTFRDVPDGTQFRGEISWLASAGVSTGWDDGTFRPVQAVNRDAMAAFMYRFLLRAQPLSAGTGAAFTLGPLAVGHNSGLVRLSVRAAKADVTVSVAGAPALDVAAGRSGSTVLLVPIIDGGTSLEASADTDVSVQLLATFDDAPAAPGSTVALPAAATRADTDRRLAGDRLSQDPLDIGVTGAGGVPATDVRAVYVTATVDLAAADTLKLGDQALAVKSGTTSVTTVLTPSNTGTVTASLANGTGALRLDVRGYVTDAAQDAPNTNVSGSYVPVEGARPQDVSVTSTGTSIFLPGAIGDAAGLMLVSAEPNGEQGTLTIAPDGTAAAGGALADAATGVQPQLAFVPLKNGLPRAVLTTGNAAASILPLGTFISSGIQTAGTPPTVQISSPAASSRIDLGETGKLTLEGTVDARSAPAASVVVSVGGVAVGTAKVRQTSSGISWSFETSVPQSGTRSFTVTATDRAAQSGSASIGIDAVLPAASAQIVSPDAVQVDTNTHPVQAVTPTSVTFANAPDVSVGQIIVEPASAAAPNGLLRNVTAVDNVAGSTVVTTTQAALTDVFLQVNFTQEVPLDSTNGLAVVESGAGGDSSPGLTVVDEGVPAAVTATGTDVALGSYTDSASAAWSDAQQGTAGLVSERLGAIVPQATIDESVEFKSYVDLKGVFACDSLEGCKFLGKAAEETVQKAKEKVAASAGYSIGGEARVGLTLKLTLKTSLQWSWGVPRTQVDEFSTIVHSEMSAKATTSAYLKAATTNRVKHQLATLKMAPITFMVLTIPVVILPSGTVYLQANFSAETSFVVDIGVERTQDYGFRYSSNGGFRNIDSGPTMKFSNPVFAPGGSAAITGKINAGFGPTLKAGLLIYGFAGPTFTIGAQAGVSAAIVFTGDGPKADISLFIGGDVVVAVELTVPIIDKKILDAVIVSGTYTWNIKSWRWGYNEAFPGAPLPPDPGTDPPPTPEPGAIADVRVFSGGYLNAYALKNDGSVLAWGRNQSGQLGDGTTESRTLPVAVPGLSMVTAIASSGSNGYALQADGSVWAWGDNSYGQVGDGTLVQRLTPVRVRGLPAVKAIYAGSVSAYALGTDGSVWAWGMNRQGELGDGTQLNRSTPTKVQGIGDVTSMAVGAYETAYALRSDGSVWAWGSNSHGQLGNGTTVGSLVPSPVRDIVGAVAVSSGFATAYALLQDGTVRAWGDNGAGQIGDGTTSSRLLPVAVTGLNNVVRVEAGSYSNVFAKRTDGSIWGWGDDTYGQMFGPGSSPGPGYPMSYPPRLLAADIPALRNMREVTAGGYGSSYALDVDGDAWAWGNNLGGQLGDGTYIDRRTLVRIGVQG